MVSSIQKLFYNYLSAWTTNDALAYGASHANLRPEPRMWYHAADDVELKIPKSAPLVYTQLPFYLHGLGDTQHITKLIAQVRSLCQKFEEKGLPNFPLGIPFLFWEQYLGLRQSLGFALLCALVAVFLVVAILLLKLVGCNTRYFCACSHRDSTAWNNGVSRNKTQRNSSSITYCCSGYWSSLHRTRLSGFRNKYRWQGSAYPSCSGTHVCTSDTWSSDDPPRSFNAGFLRI
ncbi:hypothetical protein L9F63_027395 [Diploptera punctata]|uniref:Uncharacterized protein n=1 Tax=Diploptera punctata TaxID=6984 RepID=A0AAD8A8U3_DIPPU|nr:hypothetical protein L9F63_027395 [Diploptera punctata]